MSDDQRHIPLSVRTGDAAAAVAHSTPAEGIPPHLWPSLRDWLNPRLLRRAQNVHHDWVETLRLELIREFERVRRVDFHITEGTHRWDALANIESMILAERNGSLGLDLANFLLERTQVSDTDQALLRRILLEAGSVWTVDPSAPRLARRVEPTLELTYAELVGAGGVASQLLQEAWGDIYGQQPDPSDGYRQAIRAVEAVSCPLILPRDNTATLGKVIGHMKANRNPWSFVLPGNGRDVDPQDAVLDHMRLLWTSQYDRHVTNGTALSVSQPEAEAALPVAITLVQWFTGGAITINP
jgi:hypothetical protein